MTAYASMLQQLTTRLKTVEGLADETKAQDLLVYVSAIVAGLEEQVLTDRNFQSQLVGSLGTAATGGDAVTSATFTNGVTKSLQNFANDANVNLGTATSAQAKVFKAGAIAPDSVPTAASYTSAVLAPVAVTYTAATATAAGSVVVTPPLVTTGISSYNVYFGGATAGLSHGKLLGTIAAGSLPLTLVLPAGTSLPTGDTLVWVYPVTGDGSELSWPASTPATASHSSTTYTVTATGDGNETFTPATVQTVKAASTQAYTVTPKSGFTLVTSVSGSCPQGSWNASTYTTAAITANCTVGFSATSISAPTQISVTNSGTTNTLTFTAVSGATSYNVYWSTSTPVTTVSTKVTNATSPFVQTNVAVSATFYYRVTAVFGASESSLSSEVNVAVVGVPYSWVGALTSSTATAGWSLSTATPATGDIDGGFNGDDGVAVDTAGGFFYVTDNDNNRISKYNSRTGAFIGAIGALSSSTGTCPSSGVAPGWCTGGVFTAGAADGAFSGPSDVAIDTVHDALFVTDYSNNRISKFVLSTGAAVGSIGYVSSVTGGGTCVAAAAATSWCTGGTFSASSVDGGYNGPVYLAIDVDGGFLYDADGSAPRIEKIQLSGAFVGAIGKLSASTGTCPNSGIAPGWCTGGTFVNDLTDGAYGSLCGISIDTVHDAIYPTQCAHFMGKAVLSTGAFVGRVGKVTASTGSCPASGIASTWCTGGTFATAVQDGAFNQTYGTGVDSANNVLYISDALQNRVIKMNPDTGAFIGAQGYTSATSGTCPASGPTTTWCTGGTFSHSSTLGGFGYPQNPIPAADGYIYVVDFDNSRLSRIAK